MDTLSVFSHGVQYYIITNSNIFCTVQIVCKRVYKRERKRIEKDNGPFKVRWRNQLNSFNWYIIASYITSNVSPYGYGIYCFIVLS